MMESDSPRSTAKWGWIGAIAFVLFVNLLSFGTQGGQCIDYAVGSGAESFCTSGPAIGVAATWALGIVSLLAVAYFIYRLTRSLRAR